MLIVDTKVYNYKYKNQASEGSDGLFSQSGAFMNMMLIRLAWHDVMIFM
jgi:hypothetical protein